MHTKLKNDKIPIEKILLGILAGAGLLTLALVAPNAIRALESFGIIKRKYRREYVSNAVQRLKRKEYITYEIKNEKKFIRLTEKGETALRDYQSKEYKIPIPKKWDKKWRIVIFDIKESRKSVRDKIRRELRGQGFLRLQDSVWIIPYDCEEYVTLLKADKQIGKDILYIVAEQVEYDRPYRELFRL